MAHKTHTVTCEDCGKQREVRINKNPPRCRSCAQKRAQSGQKYSPRHGKGRKCANLLCDSFIRPNNQIGYCYNCFHANVDNIKTEDQHRRRNTPAGRIKCYAQRGGRITEADLEKHDTIDHCQWCEKFMVGTDKHLDHCHKTGKYRGTLCRQCNASIGQLGDDLDEIIAKAKKYGGDS